MNEEPPLGPLWPPLLIAIVAIAAATPLFARDLAALEGHRYDPCIAVFGTTCPPHENPADKHVFGIPLSGLGMTYSVTVVVELLLGAWLGTVVSRTFRYLLLQLTLPAALISVYLLFLLVTGRAHGCPFCLTGNICSLLQVVALTWSLGGSWSSVPGRMLAWFKDSFPVGSGDDIDAERRRLVNLTCVAGVFLYSLTFALVRIATLSREYAGVN